MVQAREFKITDWRTAPCIPLVAGGHVLRERLVEVRVQPQPVFLEVGVEVLRAQDLGNLHQLVLVVVAVEERLLAEDLRRKEGA